MVFMFYLAEQKVFYEVLKFRYFVIFPNGTIFLFIRYNFQLANFVFVNDFRKVTEARKV